MQEISVKSARFLNELKNCEQSEKSLPCVKGGGPRSGGRIVCSFKNRVEKRRFSDLMKPHSL